MLALARLAVAEREGAPRQDDRRARSAPLRRRPSASSSSTMPRIDISSSLRPRGGSPPGGRSATWSPTRSRTYIAAQRALPEPSTRDRQSHELQRTLSSAPRSPRYAADKKAIDIVELDLRGVARLHRLLRRSARATPTARPRRSTTRIHEGMKKEHGHAPAPRRGRERGALDPHGLPRRASCTSSRPRRATSTGSSSSGATSRAWTSSSTRFRPWPPASAARRPRRVPRPRRSRSRALARSSRARGCRARPA